VKPSTALCQLAAIDATDVGSDEMSPKKGVGPSGVTPDPCLLRGWANFTERTYGLGLPGTLGHIPISGIPKARGM
jgi:hypothetical protein